MEKRQCSWKLQTVTKLEITVSQWKCFITAGYCKGYVYIMPVTYMFQETCL